MISVIDNRIDQLIRNVKSEPMLADFVFMSAYPPREIPEPMSRYAITIENAGVKSEQRFIGESVTAGFKGRLYTAELNIRVYAPDHSAGSALLRATSLLSDACERCDTDKAVRSVKLSGIHYDTAARTVYRDIMLSLEYILYEEVSDD